MIRKIVALFLVLFVATFALTACTSNEEKRNPKDENILVFDKELKNGIQLQVYRISEGTLTAKQAEILPKHKAGEAIIAVRYVLTNKSDKPVDVKNVTLWNANFKNSSNGVGSFNFSDTSLHAELGYNTLPDEFATSNQDQWMLQQGETVQFAYDWIIDSKDLIMNHYIVFQGDKTMYEAEVDLKKP